MKDSMFLAYLLPKPKSQNKYLSVTEIRVWLQTATV